MQKICLLAALFFFIACGQNRKEAMQAPAEANRSTDAYTAESEAPTMADSTSVGRAKEEKALPTNINGEVIPEANDATKRKVIRTAELKSKVREVQKTSNEIEDLTHNMGGFVTSKQLNSYQNGSEQKPISKDSVLEVISYTVQNEMVIRVPNERLDSLLRKISEMSVFVDYQRITADDVTLNYVSNRLKAKNRNNAQQQINEVVKQNGGKRLGEIVAATETGVNLGDESIDKQIANLATDEKIRFATLNLSLYQNGLVNKYVIANTSLDQYKPSFWQRLGYALGEGWAMLLELFVAVASLWAVILFLVLAFFGFRRVRRWYQNRAK